jgi:tetratricopeptide (TPR) repeat protein
MRRPLRLLVGLGALCALAGCATPDGAGLRDTAHGLPRRAELDSVPFHPQQEEYCGPAALTTMLAWSGVPTRQDAIASEVFTPGRDGTLGHDLIGAARRHGRLAVPVADLPALLAELAAGHPVLVLQNLGLAWYPQWHFAVAVGYDLTTNQLALRSGEERRRVVSFDTFSRTWARADRWALVVLPPDRLPATGGEAAVLSAAAGLERAGRWQEAGTAYEEVLRRWPGNLGALIGRGNAHYAVGDLDAAEAAYRAALEHHPGAAVAWNNLAEVLAAQGARDEALIAARRAVALGGTHAEVYRRTLEEIGGAPA